MTVASTKKEILGIAGWLSGVQTSVVVFLRFRRA
jgi:hypothetical protein